jgi:hypothetical protein
VYDMYPWNAASTASTASIPSARNAPEARNAPKAPKAAPVPPATTAVQVALDRRDNGGDAAAEPTAALARQ